VPATPVASIEEAVEYLSGITMPGDVILLSPGCSSLDMFKNYEERAQRFINMLDN
jgi:UDP-N-acetylmuramoylalanine--D-glutamate ligase